MTSQQSSQSKLHKYAFEGKKSKLKSLIKTGNIDIETPDGYGNTALYYACLNQHSGCVKALLENGANPNERCMNGETPVHAAAVKTNLKIMCMLVEYGGDLRLHDKQHRTPKTLALQQTNHNLRRRMLAFIEEARSNAKIQTSKSNSEQLNLCNIQPKSTDQLVNPCSVGFGILYKSTNEIGVPIILPAIRETDVSHDGTGPTLNNGAFMIYESMKWKDTHLVTIKRLHTDLYETSEVDLLIEELKFFRKINNFPKILSLMGFCSGENADSLMLMFERVQLGSLYNILHEIKLSKPPKLKTVNEIMLGVCDALIYLHEHNIIHCYVSSHSIILTSLHTAKLANFEYAVEKVPDANKQKKSKIVENHYVNCAYNWIAPDLMTGECATESSDMYSFCVVIWELFNMKIPWENMEWNEIQYELLAKNNKLPVDFDLIPLPFSRIIKDGFSLNPIKRMTFDDVKNFLENFQTSMVVQKPTAKVKVNRLYARPPQVDVPKAPGGGLGRFKTSSFSEGIDSINEAINSNEMATLNSLEEFDKFSQISNNSYIYCDAYKAEFHLTKNGHMRRRFKNRENSLDSKLRRPSFNERSKSNETRKNSKRSERHETNTKGEHTGAFTSNSMTNVKANGDNNATNSLASSLPAAGSLRPPTPPVFNGHLPKSAPRQHSNPPTLNRTNSTSSKTTATSKHRPPPPPLPPTPPPLPLPPQSIVSTSKQSQLLSYQQQQQQQQYQIPTAYLTPSSTPSQSNRGLLRAHSKSTDSPRFTMNNTETSTPTFKSSQLIDRFSRFEKTSEISTNDKEMADNDNESLDGGAVESSKLDLTKNAKKSFLNDDQNVHEHQHNHHHHHHHHHHRHENNHNDQPDSSHTNVDIQNDDHKPASYKKHAPPKLFGDDFHIEDQRLNVTKESYNGLGGSGDLKPQQVPTQNLVNRIKSQFNAASNSTYEQENPFRAEFNNSNNNHKLDNFIDNFARPTPEDKRRYFQFKNLALRNELCNDPISQVTSHPLFHKLNLSTNSQEDVNSGEKPPSQAKSQTDQSESKTNTQVDFKSSKNMLIEELKKKQELRTTETTPTAAANLLPRSGSCNRITDQMKSNFFDAESVHRPPRVSAPPPNPSSKQQQSQQRSQSTNMPKKSASLTQTNLSKEHKSRRQAAVKSGVACSSSAERLFSGGDFCAGQGSVRNLVLSYEEFPSKERSESDFKIQQMRQERNRELFDAVERSKIALNSRQAAAEESNPPRSASYQMQKELSTISERTENSASLNGVLVAAASAAAAAGAGVTTSSLSNTYLASPAGANPATMNSSKTTTTTRAIRNIDAQKFNFLDTSTGDNLSSSKNFNSSTPIQHANNNSTLKQTSSTTSLTTKPTTTNQSMSSSSTTKRKTVVYRYKMNRPEDEGDDEEDDDEDEDEDDDESDTETEDDPNQQQQSDYEPENGEGDNDDDDDEHFYRLKAAASNGPCQEKPQFLEISHKQTASPSMTRNEHVVRKNCQNKSHYSSQEDFLSSIHVGESSIDFSEGVYLNDFDRLLGKHKQKLHLAESAAAGMNNLTKSVINSSSPCTSNKTKTLRHSHLVDEEANYFDENQTSQMKTNNSFNDTNTNTNNNNNINNNTVSGIQRTPSSTANRISDHAANKSVNFDESKRTKHLYKNESTSTSAGAISTVTSLTPPQANHCPDDQTESVDKPRTSPGKHTNVRVDKHVIDTTKYKGYQYKLETKSNVTNKYHIKGLLTNEQTGHSLLVTNTKVKTPKILTRVIIDQ